MNFFIDINIFKNWLIDLNIFKECQNTNNRYGLSIYRTPQRPALIVPINYLSTSVVVWLSPVEWTPPGWSLLLHLKVIKYYFCAHPDILFLHWQGRGKSFLSWQCQMNYTEMIANGESCPFTKWTSLIPMGEDSMIRGRPKVTSAFIHSSNSTLQEGIYFLKTSGVEPYSYSSYLA